MTRRFMRQDLLQCEAHRPMNGARLSEITESSSGRIDSLGCDTCPRGDLSDEEQGWPLIC